MSKSTTTHRAALKALRGLLVAAEGIKADALSEHASHAMKQAHRVLEDTAKVSATDRYNAARQAKRDAKDALRKARGEATKAVRDTLERLNDRTRYPAKADAGLWHLNAADIYARDEAQAVMGDEKDVSDWNVGSTFIKAETAARWLAGLTPEGRAKAIRDEVFGGWFADDEADFDDDGKCVNMEEAGCDEDGEFCSTPCYDDGDLAPSVDSDDLSNLDWVARGGLVFIYPTSPFRS